MPPSNEFAHFIPRVTDELVRLCCSDLDPAEGARLRDLAVAVQDTHHLRYRRRRPALKPASAAFAPDRAALKLFTDIPRADVDMLMPGARVRLKLMDRGKLGVGVLTGVGTMSYRVLPQMADFFHVLMEPGMLLWGLVAGMASYAYKSYFDYQTTRQRYHLSLTQSLYFQNLDSNVGVLTRLFDEAEEQETRTALLGYFCLLRHAGPAGVSAAALESAMGVNLARYA